MLSTSTGLVRWILSAFTNYKLLLERSISFSDDALHIFAGVLIQLAVAAALRSSIAHWRPLLAVLFAELMNEFLDIKHELWPSPSMQLGESIKDVLLTVALPLVFFALSRWAPSVLASTPAEASSKDELEGAPEGSDLEAE